MRNYFLVFSLLFLSSCEDPAFSLRESADGTQLWDNVNSKCAFVIPARFALRVWPNKGDNDFVVRWSGTLQGLDVEGTAVVSPFSGRYKRSPEYVEERAFTLRSIFRQEGNVIVEWKDTVYWKGEKRYATIVVRNGYKLLWASSDHEVKLSWEDATLPCS